MDEIVALGIQFQEYCNFSTKLGAGFPIFVREKTLRFNCPST